MKNRRNKKGFTIVELVIVIGVIGILSAILIPTFASLNGQAEAARLQSNLHNAFSMYAADAVDGKYGDAETSTVYLQYVSQAEVVMENKGATERYHYSAEDNKWVKFEATFPGDYKAVAYTVAENVKTYDATKSVYNTYTVYAIPQA